MSRRELKENAKAAMREAKVNPYLMTLIFLAAAMVWTTIGICANGGMGFITGIMQAIAENSGAYGNSEALIGSEVLVASMGIGGFLVGVLEFVFSAVLSVGYTLYCLKVANRDQTMTYGDLFTPCKYFLKVVGLTIMMGLFCFLWSLLFFIPGIIASYRYSQAVFILVENPEKGIMQCIRESKEMMKGHKWECFVLELSFILWNLLGSVTCGLVFIYVLPYQTVTFANYYNAIKPKQTENSFESDFSL